VKSIAFIVLLLGLMNPGADIKVEDNRIYMEQENRTQLIVVQEKEDRLSMSESVRLDRLYGKWKEAEKSGQLEFKEDGTFVDNGKTGTYKVLDNKSIRIVIDGKTTTAEYQLDGNKLKWGTGLSQVFEKVKP
jgi:hypothetical protein